MFNASRLSIARKRRGWNKTKLALKAGVSVRSISLYENGRRIPTEDTVDRIAESLVFPRDFFYGPDLEEPSVSGASFRGLASMTAAQRDMALAAGSLAIEFSYWIDEKFDLPAPQLPDLHAIDPESASDAVRAHWGLGERGIKNMVHLLEAHGARVFSLPRDSASVNAFSVWHRGTPYVFLTTDKSGERGRFDAAHELGHLVLHQKGGPRSRESELEADRFASAFLMPRGSVLACGLHQMPALSTLIKLKKRWKVALAALVVRLRHLGLISEWHYRSLYVELSRRGYRKDEPDGIQREGSQVLSKVYARLRSDGVPRSSIARDLMVNRADLDALTFALVVSAVDGEGQQPTGGERPKLRLVE